MQKVFMFVVLDIMEVFILPKTVVSKETYQQIRLVLHQLVKVFCRIISQLRFPKVFKPKYHRLCQLD